MAITTNAIILQRPPSDSSEFSLSMYSADLSDAESLLAAKTGSCHFVQKITIFCASAITISIGSGETTPGTIDAIYLGPLPFTATSSQYVIDFGSKAMVIPKSTAFTIDSSGAGPTAILVEGRTGPAF